MTKSALRKFYLEKRQALSPVEYEQLNELLLKNVKGLQWEDVNYLHCFWPIKEKHEVDTIAIITWLKNMYPNIKIVLPQTDFVTGSLNHRLYDETLPLQKNQYGIMEPINGDLLPATLLSRVLVPLLAFDKQGQRVGYGKGFYDKFLSECTVDTEFIGLSLFQPEEKIEDTNAFDVKLDACITPYATYKF